MKKTNRKKPELLRGVFPDQFKQPALGRDIRRIPLASLMKESLPVGRCSESSELIERAKIADIRDECDGRPLWEKFRRAKARGIKIVIADCLDDEPYVSSRLAPLVHMGDTVARGLNLAALAIDAEKVLIEAYRCPTDEEKDMIPESVGGVKVRVVRSGYPAMRKYEKEALYIGSGALMYFALAVDSSLRQMGTVVTVAGDCVTMPSNVYAPIGMPVKDLLEYCGLTEEPGLIAVRGSMRGEKVTDPEKTLVANDTRAVLAFRGDEKNAEYHCIGCGRCADVCPLKINPYYILKSASLNRYGYFRRFGGEKCMGCGACSYVCPSKKDIAGTIMQMQKTLKSKTEKTDER